jgi:hypothetical protein
MRDKVAQAERDAKIMKLIETGLLYADIADRFGLNKGAIGAVVKRVKATAGEVEE